MPAKYKKRKVIRRLANGACVMKRICKECGVGFTGERNICPQCFNKERREKWKDRTAYNRRYYRLHRSKAAMLREAGDRSRDPHMTATRKKAFEEQKERIRQQMERIREAGYDPKNDSAGMIERAGCLEGR